MYSHKGGHMYPRTAFFLDMDNLTGTGQPSSEQVRIVLDDFERICRPSKFDQVYCAGTATTAYHCADYRPNYRVTAGRGKDGADKRLLELGEPEHISRRFQRVVIGSGDGIFATVAHEYARRGLKVELIAGKGGVSKSLQQALPKQTSTQQTPLTWVRTAA